MAWIDLIPVEDADGDLAGAYASIGVKHGTGGPLFEVRTQHD